MIKIKCFFLFKAKIKNQITFVHFLIICSNIFSQSEDSIYFNNCVNNFFNNISKDYCQDFPKVESSPMDSSSNNIIDSSYLFKAVHHNQVLLDINEINKLNKQYVAIIIEFAYLITIYP